MHLMNTSTYTRWAASLIQCLLEIKAKNEIKLKKFMMSMRIKTTTTNPQEQITFLLLSPEKNFAHEFSLKEYSEM